MRFEGLVFTAIPSLFTLLLVRHVFSEDQYRQNGTSYWDSHSDTRAIFFLAVLVNLGAVTALAAYTTRQTSRIWPGAVLTVVGLLANAIAYLAMTAN